jgi:hypothetical protein
MLTHKFVLLHHRAHGSVNHHDTLRKRLMQILLDVEISGHTRPCTTDPIE